MKSYPRINKTSQKEEPVTILPAVMEMGIIYALLLAFSAGAWILYHLSSFLIKAFYRYRYTFHHFALTLPPILLVLGINIFFLFFQANHQEEVRRRAGTLAPHQHFSVTVQ